MPRRISVVVSQAQSQNPVKRGLEEDIVTALIMEPGIDVTVVPHLYDLAADSTGMLALSQIGGDMVVLSWLYPRGARWTLDRNGIRGQEGVTLLKLEEDDEEEEEAAAEADDKERVIDQRDLPKRKIYCLDLRASEQAADFVAEVKRIAAEGAAQVVGLTDWISGNASPEQMQRFVTPTNDTALGPNGNGNGNGHAKQPAAGNGQPAEESHEPIRIEEKPGRRWYPVIDFSRSTSESFSTTSSSSATSRTSLMCETGMISIISSYSSSTTKSACSSAISRRSGSPRRT